MFEDFRVKPSFEDTMNSHWHFTAVKDGVHYNGHYDGGQIHWFRPQPNEQIEQVEEAVHHLMAEYELLNSEMR